MYAILSFLFFSDVYCVWIFISLSFPFYTRTHMFYSCILFYSSLKLYFLTFDYLQVNQIVRSLQLFFFFDNYRSYSFSLQMNISGLGEYHSLILYLFCMCVHRKKGHSCFENIFSFNMEILKWDYIVLIKEKYNCLNNCLLEWSHFI